jgi:hypothetical protein
MAQALRIIQPTDAGGEPRTIAEALADFAAQVAAESPVIAIMIYETRDGNVVIKSLPQSAVITRALVSAAYDVLFPEVRPEA